jgi:AcrR family transcriptional regulator
MDDAEPDAEPGLRERKRLATRRAIQLAAIELIERNGLDAVTVDEISRVADVSPRTFFNYFPSKEDAIVGDSPVVPDGELRAAFIAEPGGTFEALERLFLASIRPALLDQELVLRRRRLAKSYPELSTRRMASMHRFEFEIIGVISERLAAHDPDLATDPAALHRRARYLGLVASAVMRQAWLNWAESTDPGVSLPQQLTLAFADLPALVRSGAGR